MAETDQLKIQIVLDDGSIKDGFISVEKQAKKSADNIAGSFDGIKDTFKSLAAAFAAAFAARKIISFLEDSTHAAMEAEKATNALAASLSQIGKLTSGAVASFQEYASELQKTTGVSDDLIVQNASLLVSIGKLSGDGLKKATKASLDLATALQIDVGTAFDLVAKASSGNTGALSRYGIKISETIPKAEKFATTLKIIETRFGGLAETRLNSLEGSLTNLGNAFEDFQKSIGAFIVKSPAVRTAINFIADSFFEFAHSIEILKSNSGDIFKPLILGALELASVLNEYLVRPLELGFNLIRTGILSIYSGIQGLIALFVNFGDVVNKFIFQPIIEGFGFIGEKIVGLFNSEMAAKLKTNITAFASDVGGSLGTLAESTSSVFQDSFTALSNSADNTFRSNLGGSIDAYIAKMAEAVAASKDMSNNINSNSNEMATNFKGLLESFKFFASGFTNAALEFRTNTIASIQAVGKQAFTTLGQGISTAFTAFAGALKKGENAGKAFEQAIVSTFGNIATQLGTYYITLGLAKLFATPKEQAEAGPLIAAGAALAALGGLLGATQSAPSSPSSTGGGVAANPSSATENTPTENLTRLEPQTAVQVTIHGDVLDSDESGSRIVQLINSAFDKKGVVINQGVMA